jgi:glutamyl-tRNA synthetase
MAVAALAVLTGSAEAVRPVSDLDELAALVDLAHVSRAPAKFDEHELDSLNARLVHGLPCAAVADRLAALGVPPDRAEAFWEVVRANLTRVSDAAEWWRVVQGPVTPVTGETPDLLAVARQALPPEPWDSGTWKQVTDGVRTATGLKGKALFLPLRLALTGLDHGPDLAGLLPLIGRERALARLSGETA